MLIFWIKESLKLIGRAKSSFFLSLTSTSISVLLIAASVVILQLSNIFQNRLKETVNINVFLKDAVTNAQAKNIGKKISAEKYVRSARYIDKNKAAENFIRETGEDFRKILDYNPLPASFTVSIKSDYVQKDTLNVVISDLKKISGVEEVSFQQEFVYKILSYVNEAKKYVFVITGILFLISLYVVFSTVKLIINSKYEEMETMKLVGAKLSTIKMPIILNGVLIGFFASIIALGLFLVMIHYFDTLLGVQSVRQFKDHTYLAGILLLGPFLGFIVSLFSLRKINLKI
ncbi:MAG: permease-like cell division protein FtsX [Ignavibacteriaceae bacterium]